MIEYSDVQRQLRQLRQDDPLDSSYDPGSVFDDPLFDPAQFDPELPVYPDEFDPDNFDDGVDDDDPEPWDDDPDEEPDADDDEPDPENCPDCLAAPVHISNVATTDGR